MGPKKREDIFSSDFIKNISLIVIGFDHNGRIKTWNDRAEAITGYSKEEMVGALPPAFLRPMFNDKYPDDTFAIDQDWINSFLKDEGERLVDLETTILTKSGLVKHILWNGYRSNEIGEAAVAFVLTGTDVTSQYFAAKDLELKSKYIDTTRKRLKRYITLDPHTGLMNYRHFINLLKTNFYRALEKQGSIAMLLIDVDYFCSINNVHGVSKGNQILHRLGLFLKRQADPSFTIARFSGTEFAILMPGVDMKRAFIESSKMFACISEHDFGDKNTYVPVNLSVCMALGGFPHCSDVATPEQLLDRVVNKLHDSKNAGGNSIMVCSATHSGDIHHMAAEDAAAAYNSDYKYTMEFVNALANAVKTKDCYTQEHSSIMSNYAATMADYFGMETQEIQDVRMGAVLHDLGKIGVDVSILRKPAALTEDEFNVIKQHPQVGANIIRNVHPLKNVVPYVLYHHERYDGSGYLNGLCGEAIPLGARIISLADVFQALTSDRPYRKALEEDSAFSIIKECSGKHFDPKVVKAFFEVYPG